MATFADGALLEVATSHTAEAEAALQCWVVRLIQGELVPDIGGPQSFQFPQPTAAWAALGAVIGAVSVMGVSVLLIFLAKESMTLLGVAALAALFGGAGFGAMLGAVLAAIRADASERAAASTAQSASAAGSTTSAISEELTASD